MSKKKVLIVDDEEVFCETLKLNLERTENYEVVTEYLGVNVLSLAKKFNPNIILLDYIMPDMDGGEVLQQLQGDSVTKNIPVVFLTAIATKDDTDRDDSIIGGRHILAKPITTEEVIHCIEEYGKKISG